jgi:uncharacterized protein DUF1592/uncharacterized protein DUF1588/uncharacterized protein DUF1595/uncharacterized protein DUF1587/uncharacterized protein DUF1585
MTRKFLPSVHGQLSVVALLGALFGAGCSANGDVTGTPGPGLAGNGPGAVPSAAGSGGASGGAVMNAGGTPSSGGSSQQSRCTSETLQPTSAPIRRLTRYEFNNSVAELLGDTTSPAVHLPPEVLGNGFSNDALQQTVSADLVSGYSDIAASIASRAVQASSLAKLAPCAANATTSAAQDSCAQTFINGWVSKAYRRPLAPGEADALLALEKSVTSENTFTSGIAAVIEAVLQSPDFLYRPEFGVADSSQPSLRRPTGDEMATRLSYLFWGSPPDDALRAAAASGELVTSEGILKSAKRLLDGDKAHGVLRFFFDSLLPLTTLTDQTRDPAKYPSFSPQMGDYMRTETEKFLDHRILVENGSWPSVFTADYTFVNEPLAKFYGISGVTGTAFQKVPLDTSKRRGLLTQGAILTGTTVTNSTNPVLRGSFILNKLMCLNINLPSDPATLALVAVPVDVTGATARDRYTAHSKQPLCQGCHRMIDPVGFALENYDAVGQYRSTENNVTIDASGKIPQAPDIVTGAVQLAQQLADSELVQQCFAQHWVEYGYGRTLRDTPEDLCLEEKINTAFKASGYNVKQLLLDLTQTTAFQYLPAQE